MNEKLLKIQQELKAPKNQKNNFGGYNYRSCEDIFEAVKPILEKEKVTLRVTDELVLIGDRYYIKATAILSDGKETIENVAYAREEENKKGMDQSQITGASSSYARKYALNGLFLIDDVKDSDATNDGTDKPKVETKKTETKKTTTTEAAKPVENTSAGDELMSLADKGEITKVIADNKLEASIIVEIAKELGYSSPVELRAKDKEAVLEKIKEKVGK